MEGLFPGCVIQFEYTNHRRETATRKVTVHGVYWGTTAFYPEPQFILSGRCWDRQEVRFFAMKQMTKVENT